MQRRLRACSTARPGLRTDVIERPPIKKISFIIRSDKTTPRPGPNVLHQGHTLRLTREHIWRRKTNFYVTLASPSVVSCPGQALQPTALARTPVPCRSSGVTPARIDELLNAAPAQALLQPAHRQGASPRVRLPSVPHTAQHAGRDRQPCLPVVPLLSPPARGATAPGAHNPLLGAPAAVGVHPAVQLHPPWCALPACLAPQPVC